MNKTGQPKYSTFYSWPIIIFGFLTTFVIAYILFSSIKKERDSILNSEIETIIRDIDTRINTYEGALIQTRAFILNVNKLTFDKFLGFFQDTELLERYPGFQGIGYVVVFSPHDLEKIQQLGKSVYDNFKIWPASEKGNTSAILYLLPVDKRNMKALGLDMFKEDTRRKAMEKARDSGKAVISAKINLVQEDSDKPMPGFILYLPVFDKNLQQNTMEERRLALRGYVVSPFRSFNLFESLFANKYPHIKFTIYESLQAKDEVLYEHLVGTKSSNTPIDVNAEFGNRNFGLSFSPLPELYNDSSYRPVFVTILIGLLSTFICAWLFQRNSKQLSIIEKSIEEKKKVELVLEENNKELSLSLKLRDEFLSIASHELKTPLTSLKLQNQIQLRALKKRDPKVYLHENIEAAANSTDKQITRISRLVDDMLDVSKIRIGKLDLSFEQVKLKELTLDIVKRLEQQFIENGYEMPSVEGEEVEGYWDKLRIDQVITNFLTNAIRYGNQFPIKVHVADLGDAAHLSVADGGSGIPKEYHEKIFERFERAVSANEISGMGLGLFISKQIVLGHEGKAWVESDSVSGSTFFMKLPKNQSQKKIHNVDLV